MSERYTADKDRTVKEGSKTENLNSQKKLIGLIPGHNHSPKIAAKRDAEKKQGPSERKVG